MKHEITIKDIQDLDRAAAEFLEEIGDNTLVAFFAPMGSGKTTFTTAICRTLGVTDPATSHFLLKHKPGGHHADKTQDDTAYQHQAKDFLCVHFVSLALYNFDI